MISNDALSHSRIEPAPGGDCRRHRLLPYAGCHCRVLHQAQADHCGRHRTNFSEHRPSWTALCHRHPLLFHHLHSRHCDCLGLVHPVGAGKQVVVIACRVVSSDLCRACSRSHTTLAHCLSTSSHADLSPDLRRWALARPGAAPARFVSIRLGPSDFGIHLVLLGYLVYRSRYIPRVLGVVLVLVGLIWIVIPPGPALFPNLKLGFLLPVSAIELLLPLWLLIRGWKIKEPVRSQAVAV